MNPRCAAEEGAALATVVRERTAVAVAIPRTRSTRCIGALDLSEKTGCKNTVARSSSHHQKQGSNQLCIQTGLGCLGQPARSNKVENGYNCLKRLVVEPSCSYHVYSATKNRPSYRRSRTSCIRACACPCTGALEWLRRRLLAGRHDARGLEKRSWHTPHHDAY